MNLAKRFNNWFYTEVYPVEGRNRSGYILNNVDLTDTSNRDYWFREAFMAGANCQLEEFNKRIKIIWKDQYEN